MKSKIDTTIQFSGLKTGCYEYEYMLDDAFFSSFENEELSQGTVRFMVKLEKTERLLMINFSFSGIMKAECDRCLGEMEVPVEGEEILCVKFSDTETSDREDEVILPTSAYKIDIAQWMYEYVAVAMPMQHVHPDDEEGNPTCDQEMLQYITGVADEETDEDKVSTPNEVDPRWAKLLDLK